MKSHQVRKGGGGGESPKHQGRLGGVDVRKMGGQQQRPRGKVEGEGRLRILPRKEWFDRKGCCRDGTRLSPKQGDLRTSEMQKGVGKEN